MENLCAAILVGGLGTRLRPVTHKSPKVLAEVNGRPFLAYVLDKVAATGIGDAVLCTGYRAGDVRDAFGDGHGHLRLVYSQEPRPLGTAGALRLALPHLKSETVLVLNGDSFCSDDFRVFYRWHIDHGAEGSLMLVHEEDTSAYGRVAVDEEDERIRRFDEKADAADGGAADGGAAAAMGPGWVNAGVYLLARGLIASIPAGREVSIEKEMFPIWAGRGLFGYRGSGTLLDIGTPERYGVARDYLASQAGQLAEELPYGD